MAQRPLPAEGLRPISWNLYTICCASALLR